MPRIAGAWRTGRAATRVFADAAAAASGKVAGGAGNTASSAAAGDAQPGNFAKLSSASLTFGSLGAQSAWSPLGLALRRFWDANLAAGRPRSAWRELPPLLYWSDLRPRQPEALPAEMFFRGAAEMPRLERYALEHCHRLGGRVLDVGAGAGSHVAALQAMGLDAEGVDIDPQAVEVMQLRGLTARCCSLWELKDLSAYDTVLLLMNSAGAVGTLSYLRDFFAQMFWAMAPHGRVLLDVSPPNWEEVHAASSLRHRPSDRFPARSFREGEWAILRCRLSFGDVMGQPFPLLFVEPGMVTRAATQAGWQASLRFQDERTRHSLLELQKPQSASRVRGGGVVRC